MDAIVVVRDGVVSYGVVAGRVEADSIVVVRSNYILYYIRDKLQLSKWPRSR